MKLKIFEVIMIIFLISTLPLSAQKKTKEERQKEIENKKQKRTIPDTITTKSGYKITKDQEIRIGVGSTPDGDFKFIRRNSSSLFAYYSTSGHQGFVNSANAFPRNKSGYKYKVKAIESRGNKTNGYVNYLKISDGIVNYEIDIENAITFGEIVVPDEFKKKQEIGTTTVISIADEIIKLKKLQDEGILTKEEFESQKAKLLNK